MTSKLEESTAKKDRLGMPEGYRWKANLYLMGDQTTWEYQMERATKEGYVLLRPDQQVGRHNTYWYDGMKFVKVFDPGATFLDNTVASFSYPVYVKLDDLSVEELSLLSAALVDRGKKCPTQETYKVGFEIVEKYIPKSLLGAAKILNLI